MTSERKAIALETDNEHHRIALRGVRVRSRIAALCHKTTVEQTFINLEPRAIEAIYTFPLPEQAAVCGFEVITGDRVLTGKIEESERAIEQYEESIARGDAAYMLERDRPDVFTLRVGNIKPSQAATIRITYVAQVDRADRSIRIAYPTTVAPRFVSSAGMDPIDAVVDGDALNPPHVWAVPYGLSLEVDVQLAQKVLAIRSPSHQISVWNHDDQDLHRVMLASGQTAMDRDIVLEIELKREPAPAVQVARGRDARESYLAVTFIPEFDVDELPAPAPGETVFVLDCSGSMQGASIAQAIAALGLCLRALSPGDTFNICRFGSSFEMLSSEPLVYSDATLRRALAYIERPADLGGTELHAPLHAIFSTPIHVGKQRQIVLLTDGQVGNEPALVKLARQHRSTHRIFTFGIGTAASSFLVRGLARATGGAAEFISEGERIEEKVLRTFGRIASPMISDVLVDWGDAEVQTLAEIPPVFDGDVLTVFGRALGRGPKEVTLRCVLGDSVKSWTVPVPAAAIADDDGVIATMWARRMIQSLEEVNDIQRRATRAGAKPTPQEQMVMDLSREFGLLSSLTTYIAVEHRSLEERNDGRPELRRVPVLLAKGWGGGGIGGAAAASQMMMALKAPRRFLRSRAARVSGELLDELVGSSFAAPEQSQAPAAAGDFFARRAAPTEASRGLSPMHAILSLQSAEGWFERGDPLDDAALSRLKSALPAEVAKDDRVVQTILAILNLRESFAADERTWRRAVDKARRWLALSLRMKLAALDALLASQTLH